MLKFLDIEVFLLIIIVISIITTIIRFIIKKLIPLALTGVLVLGVVIYLWTNYM